MEWVEGEVWVENVAEDQGNKRFFHESVIDRSIDRELERIKMKKIEKILQDPIRKGENKCLSES